MSHCGVVSVTARAVDDMEDQMAKLTDTQLIVLSKASQRDDGAGCLPEGMAKGAARKLATALVTKRLMREVRSKSDMPVWRRDEDNRCFSLVLLKAGRTALGVEEEAAQQVMTQVASGSAGKPVSVAAHKDDEAHAAIIEGTTPVLNTAPTITDGAPTPGSKRSRVIGMLSSLSGSSLADIVAATGWLPHTSRAVLSGLRKAGFEIERQRVEGAVGSVYRIVSPGMGAE